MYNCISSVNISNTKSVDEQMEQVHVYMYSIQYMYMYTCTCTLYSVHVYCNELKITISNIM